MAKEYIEKRNGGYYVAGARVSLDSIVYDFLRGQTAESIWRSFPVLTLEEVYGAIAFYLAHQSEVEATMAENEGEFEALRQKTRAANPELYQRLEEARQQAQSPRK